MEPRTLTKVLLNSGGLVSTWGRPETSGSWRYLLWPWPMRDITKLQLTAVLDELDPRNRCYGVSLVRIESGRRPYAGRGASSAKLTTIAQWGGRGGDWTSTWNKYVTLWWLSLTKPDKSLTSRSLLIFVWHWPHSKKPNWKSPPAADSFRLVLVIYRSWTVFGSVG